MVFMLFLEFGGVGAIDCVGISSIQKIFNTRKETIVSSKNNSKKFSSFGKYSTYKAATFWNTSGLTNTPFWLDNEKLWRKWSQRANTLTTVNICAILYLAKNLKTENKIQLNYQNIFTVIYNFYISLRFS